LRQAPPETRTRFAELLGALAASGRVWLAVTLRADLYAAWLALPALKTLKDAGATYDLAPPGAAELAEIVSAPAGAAALTFDADPATGERLDEVLLREADRPDMLPLVQLALSRLWEARETRGSETVLPLSAYRQLGGVKGIIEEAGENAVKGLDMSLLPPLIRKLGELTSKRGGTADTITSRAVPLAEAAPDPASRALVDALVKARLLTLSDDAGINVRLAHQRVLSDWKRAATIVTDSADFYRVRDEVENRHNQWKLSKHRKEFLLPRGLPLAEARAVADKYKNDLGSDTIGFIEISQRYANRSQTFAWISAFIFATTAVFSIVSWRFGNYQKNIAQENFRIAQDTVKALENDLVSSSLHNGLPTEIGRQILYTAQESIKKILGTHENNIDSLRIYADLLRSLSEVSDRLGINSDALDYTQECISTYRNIINLQLSTDDDKLRLAEQLGIAGGLNIKMHQIKQAKNDFLEQKNIRESLYAKDAKSSSLLASIAVSKRNISEAEIASGNNSSALDLLKESLSDIKKAKSFHDGYYVRDELMVLMSIADLLYSNNKFIEAVPYLKNALDDAETNSENYPGNSSASFELALTLSRIGMNAGSLNKNEEAMAAYDRAVDIILYLQGSDPDNIRYKSILKDTYLKMAGLYAQKKSLVESIEFFNKAAEEINSMIKQDGMERKMLKDLTLVLKSKGLLQISIKDYKSALNTLTECLKNARDHAKFIVNDFDMYDIISDTLENIGIAQEGLGDEAGASKSYLQGLNETKSLSSEFPGEKRFQDKFVKRAYFVLMKMQKFGDKHNTDIIIKDIENFSH
jgi:tetratricopeptide (TPR) repeat protein